MFIVPIIIAVLLGVFCFVSFIEYIETNEKNSLIQFSTSFTMLLFVANWMMISVVGASYITPKSTPLVVYTVDNMDTVTTTYGKTINLNKELHRKFSPGDFVYEKEGYWSAGIYYDSYISVDE